MNDPCCIRSKWLKTEALLIDKTLRDHIPKTSKLRSKVDLNALLDEFNMVYVKPDRGTYGRGVMRIDKVFTDTRIEFRIQSGYERMSFDHFHSMYEAFLQYKKKRTYLVQQGIELLQFMNRRFDVRVMVQISPEGCWESTGIIGRVSAPNKIITNYHSGGMPMPIEPLLHPYLDDTGSRNLILKLNQLGLDSAVALKSAYPGMNMIGVDVGIDQQLKPWILEVNTKPDVYLFKTLENKAMYAKIYRYAKHLGRV